jgi:mannose-6-phosphate isomerase-like protein (cupin superfamily)
MRKLLLRCGTILVAVGMANVGATEPASGMIVVEEKMTVREETPPHGAIGMSTAYRITDDVPGRTMEFRKRILHVGAAIGLHPIDHDEVYYVLSGKGEVTSNGLSREITSGTAAYLFRGATVGVRQIGDTPLALIISYPLKVAAVPAKN